MSEYSFDTLREGLRKLLLKYCNKKVFKDCSVAWYNSRSDMVGTETIRCNDDGCKIAGSGSDSPLFDLASLTKPLVTLLCVLTLVERKIIQLDDSLEILLDQQIDGDCGLISLKNLLCHNSGLPAHAEFWSELSGEEKEIRKHAVIEKILSKKRENGTPKAAHIYSDLGYILLGIVIERKTGKALDDFWEEEIAGPIGIKSIVNFPRKLEVDKEKYAGTGRCPWTGDVLQGVVNDDNCRILGGVCGHAGLFGTAPGVLTLCQEMFFLLKKKNSPLPFSHELFESCCKRVSSSEWTMGFNLPSGVGSSSGSYFSKKSLGHMGFTGTSFWIDPVNDLIVVLLTNRVAMGDDRRGIQKLRPAVHDFLARRLKK